MRPNKFCYDNYYQVFNYGISKTDSLNLGQLLSLILYCDYSVYCSKFSASFRPLTRTESMKEVKIRNSAFFWQSKYFREVVEGFGHYGYSESGPFYTGLDKVMAIPEFSLHLAAPTSTSKHLEVSLIFCQKDGMIIELDNSQDHYQSNILPFFDVSWLSRYPEEDERIFAGAFMPIKVMSVRIIKTRQNFDTIFKSLFLLDAIVSDGEFNHWTKTNDREIQLILKLFDLELLKSSNVDIYVKNLITSYIRRKRKIIINIYGLRNITSKLSGLVFDGDVDRHKTGDIYWDNDQNFADQFIGTIEQRYRNTIFIQNTWNKNNLEWHKQWSLKHYKEFNSSKSNAIHPAIISLLPNASEIIIKTASGGDYNSEDCSNGGS